MEQLIKQALGVQPRDLPLQTRSLQMTMRWRIGSLRIRFKSS